MTSQIVMALEESPSTTLELAIVLDLPRAAIAARVTELNRKGIIRAGGIIPAPGQGRPATIWEIV